MNIQKNKSEESGVSEALGIFLKITGIDVESALLIKINSSIAHDKKLIRVVSGEISQSSRLVVIVVDDSKSSTIGRIFNILFRRRTFRICKRLLAQIDFNKTELYAFHPSFEKLTLAYPINSSASRYADQYLIPTTRQIHKRILINLLQPLTIGSPKTDVFAIVGIR